MKQQCLSCIVFVFLFNGYFCLDPFYEACVPKDCGDGRSISFPFFINGLQDPSCGYPGFKLRCNINGSSVLQISENDYLVKDIDYKKRILRLVNTPDVTTCFMAVANLSFDPKRFVLERNSSTELVLLTNCSKVLPANLTRYSVRSCYSSRATYEQLVMLRNDNYLEIGQKVCTRVVEFPVELPGRERGVLVDGGNYEELMRRGLTITWLAPDCGQCERSGGKCGFNMSAFQFRCFCSDRPHRVSCRQTTGVNRMPLLLATASSAGIVTILVVIVLCFIRKRKWRRKRKKYLNVENFLKNHEFSAPKRYSYSQVKKMTNSFKVKLGQGGFGSVYRGELSNGNLVAVKVLNELKGNGEDFINEVASVGQTSHVNIVSLLGFCFDGAKKALIYEFMPNGSLERFIYGRESSSDRQLGWEKLHKIAIGTARGLEYLHSGCNTRILHFDIKPHNILLDKDLCPKISDFGLAKLFPEEKSMISMSHMRGTPGYIAPELFSRNFGNVSHKSDVYSYGMMILEMVGGRNNIEVGVDHTSEIYFPHWIYKTIVLDEQLGLHGIVSDEESDEGTKMVKKMIIVGLWCIQTNPLSRPTITRVLEMLEGDLASLEIPPKPYLSSPSRPVGSWSTD